MSDQDAQRTDRGAGDAPDLSGPDDREPEPDHHRAVEADRRTDAAVRRLGERVQEAEDNATGPGRRPRRRIIGSAASCSRSKMPLPENVELPEQLRR